MNSSSDLLPGQRLSRSGRPRIDYPAVAALAFPFMVNSAIQAVLNATDTWFIGRISPTATAAIGAVYWPVLVFVLLFGGVGLAVQTLVAQSYGARRFTRASQASWTGLWASLFTIPIFALLAISGRPLFGPFGIPADTLNLAQAYWFPRMLGGPLAVAVWSVMGFFNGIGRPGITLRIAVAVGVTNALFNQLFMFNWGMGVAGSAWATDAAQLLGLAMGVMWLLAPSIRARYRSHLTWRLQGRALRSQMKLGFPMGVLSAADIFGFAIFQLIEVRLGTVDGAATQIDMMLTSFCYMPALGIALAATTLVGQSIGAHRRDWAGKLGNGMILITVLYMGTIGLLLAFLGPWILPWFTNPSDPSAAAVITRASSLLWIAAGYQLFDGLMISSYACLRGAGDVRLPAVVVLVLSWLLFVPLAHSLAFAPGQGWVNGLPQFGFGAVGGWFAALTYICALGVIMSLRWYSGAWRRIELS